MRILMALGSFLPRIGGVETHVYQLSKQLAVAGHEVAVLAESLSPGAPREETMDGVRVFRSSPFRTTFDRQVSYVRAMRDVTRIVAPDVIHSHMVLPGAFAAGLVARSVPVVVTVHGDDVAMFPDMQWGHRLKVRNRLATDWSLRRAKLVISVCAWLAEFVYPIVGRDRVRVIFNGIDVDERAVVQPVGDLVVATRRFHFKNGLRYLVEAAKALPQVPFSLAGDGPELAALRALAPDNVSFPGPLGPADVGELYDRSRFTVMPSLAEMMPYSGLESMLHGRAVVGTTVGGIPELVEDGETGLIMPPRDAGALAEAIGALYGDRERAQSMGLRAREVIRERHAWSVVLPQVMRAYDDALSAGGPGARAPVQ